MNPQSNPPASTASEKRLKDDVTERERSPCEDAFYESFILQSRSDVENLYASNIYWSQKHAKEVKDLNRQKMVKLSSMTKEQKEMVKRMQKLQEKQDQLIEVKMKQYLAAKESNGRRTRPQSTSALPNSFRQTLRCPEPPRPRSGSSSLLEPNSNLSLARASRLSKSSQNLSQISSLEVRNESLKSMSRSCENLSSLGLDAKQSNTLVLPAISHRNRSIANSSENVSEDDTFFITKFNQSSSTNTDSHGLLVPAGFSPERRRGSLPNPADELDRLLELERQRNLVNEPLTELTQAKWVPKNAARSLPPI